VAEIIPLHFDADGRITNKPDLFMRCGTCKQRKPINGSVIVSTFGGIGRAYRCAECTDAAR
jgi:hypothetical protein